MKRDEYLRMSREADVFSCRALELTFMVLRKKKPSLALVVQNILNSPGIEKPCGDLGDPPSEFFRVQLNPLQIKDIVEALALSCSWRSGASPINQVLLRSLLDDWIALAQQLLEAHLTQSRLNRTGSREGG
jgi:hypothetical protein